MAELRQFRVQFIDEGRAEDIDVLTSAKSVSLQNGKTVQALFDEGGLDGTMWHIGTSAPSSSLGKDKDFYMNKTTYDIYIKQSGQWGLVGNIKGSKGDPGQPGTPGEKGEPGTPGQKGEPGEPGTKGADGATWLFGTAVPSSEGKRGDFYLKTDTFDIYSKATGSWVKTGNIKGAKGDQGQQGQPGTPGSKGEPGTPGAKGDPGTKGADGATWLFGTSVPSSQGKTGDFYLKTDTFDIYSKATGSWVKTGNIKGAKGDPGQQGQPGEKGEPGDGIRIGESYEQGTPAKIFFKLMN